MYLMPTGIKRTFWYCPVKRTTQRRGLLRRVVRIVEVKQSQESAKHFYYMVRRDKNSEMGEEAENVEGVMTRT